MAGLCECESDNIVGARPVLLGHVLIDVLVSWCGLVFASSVLRSCSCFAWHGMDHKKVVFYQHYAEF
jgi:hypothetical protein